MNPRMRTDVLLLVAFCGFLLFYGLGAFGLLGADEPRYAQVAREMLERRDWITPTLQGKPWLEKPVLYYWQAMLAYSLVGVTDRAARLPAAADAALLILAVYLFLRKFHPGSEIADPKPVVAVDGALITAGCAGIVGFARGASTDMPLAATFAIALLAWYAWYEGKSRTALAVFYVFLALATLAKGPVAPVLAGAILLVFAAVKRDWQALLCTFWIPGVVAFLAIALPWYVAVQVRNPEFFRVFILEHNFARFSHDLYHHRQPFWFYLPVLLLALMPWALWFVLAVVERVRLLWSEGKATLSSPDDSWLLFLMIWVLMPVVFFSASQSKLPGYILPSVPAGTLLVAEYLRARRGGDVRVPFWLAGIHAVLCGLLVFAGLAAGGIQINRHLMWGTGTYVSATLAAVVAMGIAAALLSRAGLRLLRSATMIPIVLGVAAVLRLAAPAVDAAQSARPIAQSIQAFSHEAVPVALYHASRESEYGLAFYLNSPTPRYEAGQVPREGHVLVAARDSEAQFSEHLKGRKVSYLTSIPAQKLEIYWVGASP